MNEETSVFNGGISELWAAIAAKQGDTFYTAKNLPFTYKVKGGELFTDRRDPSIQGPKKLNVYGAPYVWAVLKKIGAVPVREQEEGQG